MVGGVGSRSKRRRGEEHQDNRRKQATKDSHLMTLGLQSMLGTSPGSPYNSRYPTDESPDEP